MATVERALDSTVDVSLAAVVLVAPWFMGGRHPTGELALVICAVTGALAWLARQIVAQQPVKWVSSGGQWLILGTLCLLCLQVLPLPPALLKVLSTHSSQILPLWSDEAGVPVALGCWNQVSMAPGATFAGLAVFAAHALVFLLAVQRLQTIKDVERLLTLIAIGTVSMASIGLLQYLAGNGKFMWVYEHPHRNTLDAVKGPFINKNHFAQMLALGIGPLLWSLQRVTNQERRRGRDSFSDSGRDSRQLLVNLHLIGVGVVFFAALMTLSRGGVAVFSLATLMCLAAFAHAGLLSKKLLAATVSVALMTGVALTIHGYQKVASRLDDYSAGSVDELDSDGGRRTIWTAAIAALRDYPLLGTGVGAHVVTYPMYVDKPWPTVFTHCESGYLHTAVESGLAGVGLLLTAIALTARWCVGGLRVMSGRTHHAAIAVASGLVASAIHSLWDFVWYIPACASLTLLLVAATRSLARLNAPAAQSAAPAVQIPRQFAWLATVVVAACGTWMVSNRFCAAMAAPHWDAYVNFANQPHVKDGRVLPDETIIAHLEQVVRWEPGHANAHLRLANECLRRFDREQTLSENAIPLNQIRDAALASKFQSRGELNAWLDRAVGSARRFLDRGLWHTRQALRATALQDDGYLYLSELYFLEGSVAETSDKYLSQAMQVRPYSAKVLMAAGKQAALNGQFESALEFWRRSLNTDLQEQRQLVDLLVTFAYAAQSQRRVSGQPDFSAMEFLLEKLQPDFRLLELLHNKLSHEGYAEVVPAEDLKLLRSRFVRVGMAAAPQMSDHDRIETLVHVAHVYHLLGQDHKAAGLLQKLLTEEPNHYRARLGLATQLLTLGKYLQAEEHLEWCQQRTPDDAHVNDLLSQAIKGRVNHQTRALLPGATR